jgi:hypothetical protein
VSLNRYATKRDINEAEIVAALRAVGATVVQLDKPVDLLVGFQGKTVLCEVKQPGTKVKSGDPKFVLTPNQKKFYAEWKGGELYTVRSVEQALAVLGIADRGVEIGPRIIQKKGTT